jgi:AbrB family looped-hinge helix DNA binding protein
MKLIGFVELGTHNRITIPSKAADTLKLKLGDMLLVYDDKGAIVIKKAPDED